MNGEERISWIMARVMVATSGCWEWQGWRNKYGYGQTETFQHGTRKSWLVHRLMWSLHNGPIPLGAYICHHCDNPSCCNPNHLYLGNQTTNMRDCVRRGRLRKNPLCGDDHPLRKNPLLAKRGESHYAAKLKDSQVAFIRSAAAGMRGENGRLPYGWVTALAKTCGLPMKMVSRIASGDGWKHVLVPPKTNGGVV